MMATQVEVLGLLQDEDTVCIVMLKKREVWRSNTTERIPVKFRVDFSLNGPTTMETEPYKAGFLTEILYSFPLCQTSALPTHPIVASENSRFQNYSPSFLAFNILNVTPVLS